MRYINVTSQTKFPYLTMYLLSKTPEMNFDIDTMKVFFCFKNKNCLHCNPPSKYTAIYGNALHIERAQIELTKKRLCHSGRIVLVR